MSMLKHTCTIRLCNQRSVCALQKKISFFEFLFIDRILFKTFFCKLSVTTLLICHILKENSNCTIFLKMTNSHEFYIGIPIGKSAE